MVRKKKSGFFTFCFSFLPGAGEMYLGFMRMGISLMGAFFALIALASMLHLSAIMYIGVVVWFYSFFHVHNLAALTDEEFLNTKDEYLFNLDEFFNLDTKNVQKYRKIIAVALIVVGILLLWNGVKAAILVYLPDVIFNVISRLERTIPQILVGIAIIVGGFYMIRGKREELKEYEMASDMVLPVKQERKDAYGREEEHKDA